MKEEKSEKKGSPKPPQSSQLLRLLGGGYLVYLSFDLLKGGIHQPPLIVIGAIVYGIVGAVLTVWTGLQLYRDDYFRNTPRTPEVTEETTEEHED